MSKSDDWLQFAAELKQEREARKYSQRALGKELGITAPLISAWENADNPNETRTPSRRRLLELARLLHRPQWAALVGVDPVTVTPGSIVGPWPALGDFLNSPMGEDVTTAEKTRLEGVGFLRGEVPTVQTYYFQLMLFRTLKP